MSFPWTLIISTAVGMSLMFAPGMFGVGGIASDVHHVAGALIVVTSVIAMGEPLRATRLFNRLLALTVIASPWLWGEVPTTGRISAVMAGLLVIALAIPRGPKYETYGSWERWVF